MAPGRKAIKQYRFAYTPSLTMGSISPLVANSADEIRFDPDKRRYI